MPDKGEQITQPHCLKLGGNVRNRRGDVNTRIGIYDPGASLYHGLRHLEDCNDEIKGMVNDDSRCRRLECPFEKHEGVDVVHIVLIDNHADEFVGQDSGYDKPRYSYPVRQTAKQLSYARSINIPERPPA